MTTVVLVLAVLVWLVSAVELVVLLVRGWSNRRGSRDRVRAVLVAVDSVVLLAVVRALFPPPGLAVWAWLPAAAALGLGVAGLIRRWPSLPTVAASKGRPAAVTQVRLGLAIGALHLLAAAAAVVVLA